MMIHDVLLKFNWLSVNYVELMLSHVPLQFMIPARPALTSQTTFSPVQDVLHQPSPSAPDIFGTPREDDLGTADRNLHGVSELFEL